MGACAAQGALLPPQLRRLTAVQYRNTLEAAFGTIFGVDDLPDFQDDYPTVGLANDPARLHVTTVSVDSIYAAARSASTTISTQDARVVDCLEQADQVCFGAMVDDLGQALWRRPVSAQERADLLDAIASVASETGTRAQQMELLLQALLMSPNTLYRTEVGDGPGELTQLTDYELASLLSYTLTDAPPDAELLDLAARGSLNDPDVMAEQTERLMGSQAFTDSLVAFFSDYLKLDNIHGVGKADQFGLTAEARSALSDSARATLRSRLSGSDASFMDVFHGQDFEMNAAAAPFFGVEDALGEELQTVQTPATEREGILTHPAFLSVHAGNGNTGIVKRGVFALKQLLGYDLPDPPDNIQGVAEDELPEFDPDQTSSRELLQLTHSRQDRCNACHRVIDPAGFGFENWDPVGRFRLTEKQDVPIDASGEIVLGQETLTFEDGVDYLRPLAQSSAMRQSVLQAYFAYAMGRSASDCELQRFDQAVGSASDRLAALAQNLVQTDSFAVREQP